MRNRQSAKTAANQPLEFAQTIVNQMLEAQRMWLEITTQQTALVVKTVSDVMNLSNNAPSDALSNWAKDSAESFIEAQRQWSQIALEQSGELMKAVQSGADFKNPNVLGKLAKNRQSGT